MKNILTIISFLCFLTIADIAVCQENGAFGSSVRAEVPTWQWRCDNGDALLNFNPARVVDSAHTLVFDSIPYAKNYTMVVVYKPIDGLESAVWRLDFGDESSRGLSTEHIISNNVTIRYVDTTAIIPAINTLRQSAPDSVAPYVRLILGGGTLTGSIKVAEVLYFNRRLDNSMLRRVQSALAIRYGITLGPVDYVDGRGNTVWNYADSGLYHHRVTGIGRDSTYGVHQMQSLSEMAGAILRISADSLHEGNYFMCGDNNAPLTFESAGDIEILSRRWRINCTDSENGYFHLSFDTRALAGANDSLVLLADGFPFLPSTVSNNEVNYRNVTFLSDTGTFTLTMSPAFWQTAMSSGKEGGYGRTGTASIESYVYPNPTTGNYTIEVTGASWVTVNIYNTQGVLIDSYSDSKRSQYIFNGSLPSGNTYYATITTESGTQTIKLIVK